MKVKLRTAIKALCIAGCLAQWMPAATRDSTTWSGSIGDSQAQATHTQAEQTLAPGACGGCDQTSACNSCDSACDSGCGLFKGFGKCGCDSACDSRGCDCGLLGLGIVKKSDTCFNDFISPISNPTYFEDPRNLSELRFIYLHHEVPAAAAGGQINAVAMQFRARLTERLSLIATKDGY